MTARQVSPVLVGRERELAALQVAVRACRSDERDVVLVGGEAGIGKTRLLRSFQTSLTDQAAAVLLASGACFRVAHGNLPLAGILAVLGELERAAVPERVRADLVEIHHALAGTLSSEGQPATGSNGSAYRRTRVLEQILRPIERLTRDLHRSLVLVLDDLQWADDATLDVVAFLARRLRRSGCLLVIAYRVDDRQPGTSLSAALADLERDCVLDHLILPALTAEEVGSLARSIAGGELTLERLRMVTNRSEGNPFFVEELLSLGDAVDEIPPTTHELLRLRLDGLQPDVRRLVCDASVIGRVADTELLGSVTTLRGASFGTALRAATDAAVLVQPSPGTIGVRHALLAEVARDTLLPAQLKAAHRRIARALEPGHVAADGRPDVASAPILAERANHWFHAGDRARALPALIAAGRAAELAFAWRAAGQAFERAIGLVPPGRRSVLADLHHQAGRMNRQVGENSRALQHIRAARECVDPIEDPLLAARLVDEEVEILNNAGESLAGLAVAENAYATHGSGPPEARLVLLLAAGRMRAFAGRSRDAVPLLEEALELARRSDKRPELGYAATYLAGARASLGQAHATHELHETARRAAQPDDPDSVEPALGNAADDLSELGDWEAGVAAVAACRQEGRRFGPEHSEALEPFLVWLELEIAVQRGDLNRARDLLSSTAHVSRSETPYHILRSYEAWVSGVCGDFERARSAAESARQTCARSCFEHGGIAHAGLALARVWDGDHRSAQAAASMALRAVRRFQGVPMHARLQLVAVMVAAHAADAARAAGDDRALDQVIERARRPADALARLAHGESDQGAVVAVNRARGVVGVAEWQHALGRDDPAAWRSSIMSLDTTDLRFEAAYARWRLGTMLLARREARRDATELLGTALAYCTAQDVPSLRGAIERSARAGRVAPAVPDTARRERPVPDPWHLSRREQEVLGLVAAGWTNRQIGEALFITEKTASSHVTHILDKLGVGSRVEAALVAARATAHRDELR